MKYQDRGNRLQFFLALMSVIGALIILIAAVLTQIERAPRTNDTIAYIANASPDVEQPAPGSSPVSPHPIALDSPTSYSVSWGDTPGKVTVSFRASGDVPVSSGSYNYMYQLNTASGTPSIVYYTISEEELQAQATRLASALDVVSQSQKEIQAQSTRLAQMASSPEASTSALSNAQLASIELQTDRLESLESAIDSDQREIEAQSTRLAEIEEGIDPVAIALIQRDLESITSGVESIQSYFDNGMDRVQRDIDRLYNIVIGTVITLLVTVGATTLVPLLQRPSSNKNSYHPQTESTTLDEGHPLSPPTHKP